MPEGKGILSKDLEEMGCCFDYSLDWWYFSAPERKRLSVIAGGGMELTLRTKADDSSCHRLGYLADYYSGLLYFGIEGLVRFDFAIHDKPGRLVLLFLVVRQHNVKIMRLLTGRIACRQDEQIFAVAVACIIAVAVACVVADRRKAAIFLLTRRVAEVTLLLAHWVADRRHDAKAMVLEETFLLAGRIVAAYC